MPPPEPHSQGPVPWKKPVTSSDSSIIQPERLTEVRCGRKARKWQKSETPETSVPEPSKVVRFQ